MSCLAGGGTASSSAFMNDGTGGTFRNLTARAERTPRAMAVYTRGGFISGLHASADATDVARGVVNHNSHGDLVDVTAEAVSSRDATGIHNLRGRPLLPLVRGTGRGGDTGTGIAKTEASAARVVDAVIHATGGLSKAIGVWNDSSSASLSGATITVEALSAAYGVSSRFGTPLIQNATIRATATGDAIGVLSDRSQVALDQSVVDADDYSVANAPGAAGSTIRVGSSRLGGPVRPAAGTLRCVSSYDRGYAPLGSSCLPMP